MGSPGIKEDPCCAVASAKRLTEAGLLPGAPSSSGPWGKRREVRANGGTGVSQGLSQMPHQKGPLQTLADGCYGDMQPQREETF